LHNSSHSSSIKKVNEERPGEGISYKALKNNGILGEDIDETHVSNKECITDEAKQWQGWGSALKPAWEPIIMARKPLSEKTIAENVLKYGTGGINIDASRITSNNNPMKFESPRGGY